MKYWRVAVLSLLLGGLSSAAAQGKGIFPYAYDVRTLDNGLKVIMIPMESPGLVAYYSIVRTGSRDEYEPGHSGFAHLFEHMMFRGTEKFPGPVYDSLMTAMGANANAYTTDDYTCYYLVVGKQNLPKVIEMEADRFKNLKYTEQAFKTETGAVLGEYLKGRSSPWSVLEEKLMDTAFDVHTYKHTTIGFRRDIEAMPTMYEYSKSFFKRYYRPENVVIMVVGDIDKEATFREIQKNYGDWEPGYVPPKITPEPEQKGERRAEVTYPGRTLPILAVAYKGPAFSLENKDAVACYLLGSLAFGENSDLYKKLVIQQQRVQFIEPDFGFNRDPKLLTVYTMVKNEDDIGNVENEIYDTVKRFQEEPVSPEKLKAEKDHQKYSFLMNLDTPAKVAGNLARLVALTGGIEVVDQLYEVMDSITPEDIQNAAKKYLVPQHRTVIVLKGGQK